MMKKWTCVLFVLMVGLFSANRLVAQQDEEGSKDHPLFSRMKNFYISGYETKFDAVEFYLKDSKTQTVEGQKTVVNYYLKDNAPAPSELQIRRNYVNAAKQLGGQTLCDEGNTATFKIIKNGKEIWGMVQVYNSGTVYTLTVLEKGEMEQEVTANEMYETLNKDGFIALYINFDTGKSDIKPESQPVIDQIVALLKGYPDLKVSIEGHTDNVGTPQSNKTLSDARAKSVMNAVIGKGIAANRLSSIGWGQEKPVADNRGEEGRAKNRRVEIVKK